MQKNEFRIRAGYELFTVRETCYRYQLTQRGEDPQVADVLIHLTDNQRNWGFGSCFLYLRNAKGFIWNHIPVYRIYRELELNFRVKPIKS